MTNILLSSEQYTFIITLLGEAVIFILTFSLHDLQLTQEVPFILFYSTNLGDFVAIQLSGHILYNGERPYIIQLYRKKAWWLSFMTFFVCKMFVYKFLSQLIVFQIGSDGVNSSVRKAAKFHTVSFNYNQKAVVAVLNILGVSSVRLLNSLWHWLNT